MDVLLDTSFILTCLKEKIDFLEAEKYGDLILPRQVLEELIKISKSRGRQKELALLALDIIRGNKNKFKIISLWREHVDAGIKRYAEKKGRKIIVATLDSDLKKALKGKSKLLVIRAKKKLVMLC